MNLNVTFNLFADLQYQQNNYGHFSQMECTLKDWEFGVFSLFLLFFFLPSVAEFKTGVSKKKKKKYIQGKVEHRGKEKIFMRMY